MGWIVSAGLLLFRRLDLTGSICVHGGKLVLPLRQYLGYQRPSRGMSSVASPENLPYCWLVVSFCRLWWQVNPLALANYLEESLSSFFLRCSCLHFPSSSDHYSPLAWGAWLDALHLIAAQNTTDCCHVLLRMR